MNKIEKQNVVPELGAELSKLKQEVLKQAPQAVVPKEKPTKHVPEAQKNANELAQRENADLSANSADKNLEIKLKESDSEIEGLASNEWAEHEREKVVATKTKTIHIGKQQTSNASLNLPSDASLASNANRVKGYNNIARMTQEISKIPLLGWVREDEIPENIA